MTVVEKEKLREKRKSPRKKCAVDVAYAYLDTNHTAIIRNLSPEGVFIDTRDPIDVGNKIAMEIRLSDEQDPIMIIGEVAWNSRRGMGVKFQLGFSASLIQPLIDKYQTNM